MFYVGFILFWFFSFIDKNSLWIFVNFVILLCFMRKVMLVVLLNVWFCCNWFFCSRFVSWSRILMFCCFSVVVSVCCWLLLFIFCIIMWYCCWRDWKGFVRWCVYFVGRFCVVWWLVYCRWLMLVWCCIWLNVCMLCSCICGCRFMNCWELILSGVCLLVIWILVLVFCCCVSWVCIVLSCMRMNCSWWFLRNICWRSLERCFWFRLWSCWCCCLVKSFVCVRFGRSNLLWLVGGCGCRWNWIIWVGFLIVCCRFVLLLFYWVRYGRCIWISGCCGNCLVNCVFCWRLVWFIVMCNVSMLVLSCCVCCWKVWFEWCGFFWVIKNFVFWVGFCRFLFWYLCYVIIYGGFFEFLYCFWCFLCNVLMVWRLCIFVRGRK